MNIKDRFKNPYFVFGLVGVVLTAAGIDSQSLTSWKILFDNLCQILNNPFLLASVIVAICGVLVDPSTKGFKDKLKDEDNLMDEIKEFL